LELTGKFERFEAMKRAIKTKRVNEGKVEYKTWKHPGGKLRELGPKALSTLKQSHIQ